MLKNLLALSAGRGSLESIMAFLNNSSYDEMVGIDLNKDHFKFF